MARDFTFPIGAQQILTPDDGDERLNYQEQQEAWILRDRAVEDFLKDVAQTADVAVLDGDGLIPADQLGQGATGTSVFLRGDRQWAVVPGAVAGTHSVGISSQGNTGGSTGLVTGTAIRLQLVGSNNITLSQSSNGASATVTIYGAGGAAGSNTFGISNLGNTSGTSGVVSDTAVRYLLAGGNGVTLSQSLNGASGTVTISVASQTAESQTAGISNLGNTSGTSGVASGAQVRLLLAGGNNVTLSQSVNGASATVTISGPNTVAQSNQSLGLYASSNTVLTSSGTADARSLSVRAVGAISAGVSASELVLSVAAQTAESQTHGISNLGNTSGTSGVASGAQVQLLLAGGNNVTLSQSLNGASGTVTISAAAQTAQTLGIYASSQTTAVSSSSTVDARSLSIVGQGGISVGLSGGSIILSGATGGAGAGFSAGVSNLGNTSGSTGVTGTCLVLAGVDGVTLSQSTNTAGATVSVLPPTLSYLAINTANMLSSTTMGMSRTNPHFVMLEVPSRIAFSVIDMPISVSLATSAAANTAAVAMSFTYALYTDSGDTLNPLVGGTSQTTYSWASNTANFANLTGRRFFTFPIVTTLSAGDYYFGFQYSSANSSVGTATTARNLTPSGVLGTFVTATAFADLGAAAAASRGTRGFQGQMVGTSLTSTGQTVQRSQISMTGAPAVYANQVVILRNVAR